MSEIDYAFTVLNEELKDQRTLLKDKHLFSEEGEIEKRIEDLKTAIKKLKEIYFNKP